MCVHWQHVYSFVHQLEIECWCQHKKSVAIWMSVCMFESGHKWLSQVTNNWVRSQIKWIRSPANKSVHELKASFEEGADHTSRSRICGWRQTDVAVLVFSRIKNAPLPWSFLLWAVSHLIFENSRHEKRQQKWSKRKNNNDQPPCNNNNRHAVFWCFSFFSHRSLLLSNIDLTWKCQCRHQHMPTQESMLSSPSPFSLSPITIRHVSSLADEVMLFGCHFQGGFHAMKF